MDQWHQWYHLCDRCFWGVRLSKIRQIQELVRNGLYYLTEHADNEAMAEDFDIYDVECGILTGKIQ